MPRVALILVVLALPGLAHGACKKPVSASQLQTTLDAAGAAYGRVDIDAFNGSMDKARKQVVCITEEITPSLAAELHRLEGMHAFANSARDKAMAAFAAARSLEPDYTFPTNIVPPGNPLLEHYQAKDPVCEEERIPPARGGKVRVDGSGQRKLPTDFPAIVQVLDPKGGGGITQYHWPGDPLMYEPGNLRTPAQTGLLVGGTAVAVAGLATMLFGQASTSTSTDDFPADILAASRQRSTLTGTGAGLTTAGLAAIGVSFVLPNKDAAQ